MSRYWLFKRKQGVTIIEILIVVSIVSLLSVSFTSLGSGFLSRNYLTDKTNEIIFSLMTAKINSLSGKEDSQWGVHTENGKIIMFKGSSFSPPGTVFDQSFAVPNTISITNTDVVFDKLTGSIDNNITISVSNNLGESHLITINQAGTINIQ